MNGLSLVTRMSRTKEPVEGMKSTVMAFAVWYLLFAPHTERQRERQREGEQMVWGLIDSFQLPGHPLDLQNCKLKITKWISHMNRKHSYETPSLSIFQMSKTTHLFCAFINM